MTSFSREASGLAPSCLELLSLLALLLVVIDPQLLKVDIPSVESRAMGACTRPLEVEEFSDVSWAHFHIWHWHQVVEFPGERGLSNAWLLHVISNLRSHIVASIVYFDLSVFKALKIYV